MEEYYRTLGVAPGATREEIKRAYRRLARRWHPDRHPRGSVEERHALERMKAVNEAYDVLRGRRAPSRRGTPPPGGHRAAAGEPGQGARRGAEGRATGGHPRGAGPPPRPEGGSSGVGGPRRISPWALLWLGGMVLPKLAELRWVFIPAQCRVVLAGPLCEALSSLAAVFR